MSPFKRGLDEYAMAGDDVPLVTSIIGSASVCVDCIARETKLKPAQADTALRVIVQSVTISADVGRCERCQKLRSCTGFGESSPR